MTRSLVRTFAPVLPYASSMITRPDLVAGRRRLNLTQQQLADALGVAVRTVVNWEKRTEHPEPGHGAVSEAEEERVRALLWPAQSSRLEDMSSAALIAELQQIVGILAARLEDPIPRGEPGSEFGHGASEVHARSVGDATVAPPSNGGAIRGRMGVPPRTDD